MHESVGLISRVDYFPEVFPKLPFRGIFTGCFYVNAYNEQLLIVFLKLRRHLLRAQGFTLSRYFRYKW